MELTQVKVLTVSKKIIKQLDKEYECFKRHLKIGDREYAKDSIFDFIESGKYKILGKFDEDIVYWRTGTGWALLIQMENSVILIPYFQSIRNEYPNIQSLVII